MITRFCFHVICCYRLAIGFISGLHCPRDLRDTRATYGNTAESLLVVVFYCLLLFIEQQGRVKQRHQIDALSWAVIHTLLYKVPAFWTVGRTMRTRRNPYRHVENRQHSTHSNLEL